MNILIHILLAAAPVLIVGICVGLAVVIDPVRKDNRLRPLFDFLILQALAWSLTAVSHILAPDWTGLVIPFRLLSVIAYIRLSFIIRLPALPFVQRDRQP